MSPTTNISGRKIGGYEIEEKIGEGGMGTVYRAVQSNLGRRVALKILRKRLITKNRDFVLRFLREARLSARINHPNIVQVFDVGSEGDTYYMAMELVDGRNVGEALTTRGPFPIDVAAEVVRQAACGLEAARAQNLIQRDIKPDNLLASREGVVKITDFGLAKNTEDPSSATRAGILMGTPPYISPEQVLGRDADHRSDLYALGISLFELVAGFKPFTADSTMALLMKHVKEPMPDVRRARPDAPAELAAIVYRLAEKDPARRFQTPLETADALSALVPAGAEGRLAAHLFSPDAAPAPRLSPLAKLFQTPDLPPPAPPAPESLDPTPLLGTRPASPAAAMAPPKGRYISKGIIEIGGTPEDLKKFRKYAKMARDFEKAGNWTKASEFCRKALGKCSGAAESDGLRADAARLEKKRKDQADLVHARARAAMEAGENRKAVDLLEAFASLSGGDAAAAALKKQAETTPEGFRYLGLNRQRQYEYECIKAGYVLIYIPGGVGLMGADDGLKDEKPRHGVSLSPYLMGKYPVTNAQYSRFLSSGSAPDRHVHCHPMEPAGHSHVPAFWADPRWNKAAHPVVGIDWFDAWSFASWAGLWLPTEAMWEFASSAGGANPFPWGSAAPSPEMCNWFDSRQGGTTPVDKYKSGASVTGVMDMAGNTLEWCSDWYHRSFYARTEAVERNPENKVETARKVLRGGAWPLSGERLRTCSRSAEFPLTRNSHIGMRCAMSY